MKTIMKKWTAIIIAREELPCVVRFESDEMLMANVWSDAETEYQCEVDEKDCQNFRVVAVFEGHNEVMVSRSLVAFPEEISKVGPHTNRLLLRG